MLEENPLGLEDVSWLQGPCSFPVPSSGVPPLNCVCVPVASPRLWLTPSQAMRTALLEGPHSLGLVRATGSLSHTHHSSPSGKPDPDRTENPCQNGSYLRVLRLRPDLCAQNLRGRPVLSCLFALQFRIVGRSKAGNQEWSRQFWRGASPTLRIQPLFLSESRHQLLFYQ